MTNQETSGRILNSPQEANEFVVALAKKHADEIMDECKKLHPSQQILICGRVVNLIHGKYFSMIFTDADATLKKENPGV